MITSQEMRQLEDNCGIPKQVIMENAGRGVADILRKKFDILNKQILIVAYHGNNGGDGFVAARHLCDEAEIDVLFIGRINKSKGIYDLLEVLQIVKKRYTNFILAIMGQGDKETEKKFKRKIVKLSLAENIILLGNKTSLEKYNIIKSSKVFCFLSKTESFGLALLEAVCSGLPAIAYDLEPYKNIYQNNEVFIFPKGDFKSVAKKTIEIFDQQKFGNERGQLLLEKYGNWDKIAEIEYNTIIKM